MSPKLQITIDGTDPARLTRFWATTLSYRIEPPPEGSATWDEFYRGIGVAEDDLDRPATVVTA